LPRGCAVCQATVVVVHSDGTSIGGAQTRGRTRVREDRYRKSRRLKSVTTLFTLGTESPSPAQPQYSRTAKTNAAVRLFASTSPRSRCKSVAASCGRILCTSGELRPGTFLSAGDIHVRWTTQRSPMSHFEPSSSPSFWDANWTCCLGSLIFTLPLPGWK